MFEDWLLNLPLGWMLPRCGYEASLSLASAGLQASSTMERACRAGTSLEAQNFRIRRRIYMRKR